MSFSHVLQRFVTAKETKHPSLLSSKGKSKCDENGKMSGEEARTFYETVLSSDSSDIQGVDSSKAPTRQYHKPRKRESEKLNRKPSCHSSSLNTADGVVGNNGDDDDDDDGGENNIQSCPKTVRQRVPCSSYHRLANQFLKNAQEGRLRQVQELLSSRGIDINVCDQFSWTALMCASHSGQVHVVKYLLKKGAVWRNHKDSQGRTALELARLAKHFDVVELLTSYNVCNKTKRKKASVEESFIEKTKFWCSVCEQEFTDGKKVHEGSTVHLFNTQRKPQRTFYYIPEGNVGYQMMLKSGWNEDQGLGPAGMGRKFPVKTVLKRDRLGLGSKGSDQARVTHFGPNDCSAVKRKKVNSKDKQKSNPRRISRRERLNKEKREKNWERNMRIYMNSD